MNKKYFLNVGTMKIHRVDTTDKRCKKSTHNENIQYFDKLEDAKNACDKRIYFCKLCMSEEKD